MRRIAGNIIKSVAVALVLCFVLQLAPKELTFALGATADTQTASAAEVKKDPNAKIMCELTDKRDYTSKQFRMSDGTVMYAEYGSVIHKKVDGKFEDIDNTLEATTDKEGRAFKNKNGAFDLKLSEKPKSKNMIQLSLDGHSISFGIENGNITSSSKIAEKKNTEATENNLSKAIVKNVSSGITYNSVFNNIDFEYVIMGDKLKENITINKYTKQNQFVFNYDFGDLIPTLNEDKTITLMDKDKNSIYGIEAPYMYDATHNESRDINVQLQSNGKEYKYILTADKEWLSSAERVYPVVIDPTIKTPADINNVLDTYVNDYHKDHTYSYRSDELRVGRFDNYDHQLGSDNILGPYRTYVWFKLPNLPSAARVVNADLKLYNSIAAASSNSNKDLNTCIEAYEVLGEIPNVQGLTWNQALSIEHNPAVLDYVKIRPEAYELGDSDSWNITNMVDNAYRNHPTTYTNRHVGVMLKYKNENATQRYYNQYYDTSSSYSPLFPRIEITYIDGKGLESTNDYFSSSMGSAGTGYVNAFNGNMVYSNTLLAESGSRMPLAISQTYNSANGESEFEYGLKSGLGWQLNFNQMIMHAFTVGNLDYYKYIDADGTEHYFVDNITNNDPVMDEEGMGLRLDFQAEDWAITNTKTNAVIRFWSRDGGNLRDRGYIYCAQDGQGNQITYNYQAGTNNISSIVDGAFRETLIESNEHGQIKSIKDPAGRYTVFKYASGDYWPFLEAIQYTENIHDPNSYITQVTYNYSSGLLDQITARDNTRLLYQYNALKQYTNIQEQDTLHATQFSYSIDYSHQNVTKITDNQNRSNYYQFDYYGKTVSIKDDQGYAVYSGYTNMKPADESAPGFTTFQRNKLTMQSNMQKSVVNHMINGSAEDPLSLGGWITEYWGNYDAAAYGQCSTEQKYLGNNSFKVHKEALSSTYQFRQNFSLPIGQTYTFSGYVKTAAPFQSSDGAKLFVSYGDSLGQWHRVESKSVMDTNGDWERVSVTFTNNSADGNVFFFAGLLDNAIGTAYFDCLQVENGSVMNRYNLVGNSGFERNNGSSPDAWAYSMSTSYGISSSQIPEGGNASLRIDGNYLNNSNAYQNVFLNKPQNENLVIGAWAKADAAPDNNDSHWFAMDARIQYSDNTEINKKIYFNTALRIDGDGSCTPWQLAYGALPLQDTTAGASTTKTVSYVQLMISYSYNVNTAYFDNIQVFYEEFGQTYQYDEKGNVVSTVDSAKQQTTFATNNDNLAKLANPDGSSYEYGYNANKSINWSKSAEGIRYDFAYDNFGNPTSSTLKSDYTSTSVKDDGIYYIYSKKNGKMMYITGTDARISLPSDNVATHFRISKTSDGYYKIVSMLNNTELDLYNDNTDDGAIVQFSSTNDTLPAHKWRIIPNEDGTYQIVCKKVEAEATKKALSIQNNSSDDGVLLVSSSYNKDATDNDYQRWYIERIEYPDTSAAPVNGQSYYLRTRHDGMYLGVTGDGNSDSSQFARQPLSSVENDSKETFTLTDVGSGQYTINPGSSSKVLTVVTGDSNKIYLRDYTGSSDQKFTFTQESNGLYSIRPVSNSSLAIDLHYLDNYFYAGNHHGAANQQFALIASSASRITVPDTSTNYYLRTLYNRNPAGVVIGSDDVLRSRLYTGKNGQIFKLIAAETGYYKIGVVGMTDTVLTVNSSDYIIRSATDTGSDYQKFALVKQGNSYALCSKVNSNWYVDYSYMGYIYIYTTGFHGGTNQRWIFDAISPSISSSAEYGSAYSSNYLTKLTDQRGNSVNYSYDNNRGTLSSTSYTKENEGDNYNISITTTNTYDSETNAVTSVAKTKTYSYKDENDVEHTATVPLASVSYGYSTDKQRLNSITHNGFDYTFGYDTLGRTTTVSAGGQQIVSNSYISGRGLLDTVTYGNGQSTSYQYDNLDRVTSRSSGGNTQVGYTYNNDGNLYQKTDYVNNVTYDYTYDTTRRPVSVSASNGYTQKLSYDELNRINKSTSIFNKTTVKTVEPVYGDALKNQNPFMLYGMKYNGTQLLNYSYDQLNRLDTRTLNIGSGYNTHYTYVNNTDGSTTTLLETIQNNGGATIKYQYDKLGNIVYIYEYNISAGRYDEKAHYYYDDLNQLIREDNAYAGYTYTYTYDGGGNIKTKATYAYTTGTLPANPTSTNTWAYNSTNGWKDQLTQFGTTNINYDGAGNPTNWRLNRTLTWQNGHQLAGYTQSVFTAAYKYNESSIRSSKTFYGYTTNYYLSGSTIMGQLMYGKPTDGNATNPAGQEEVKAFDADANSKWLVYSNTGALMYQMQYSGIVANKYTVTSAEDYSERDPKDWVFEGSNDGYAWTSLDSRSGESFANRHQTNTYSFTNDNYYTYYRLRVTANMGGTNAYLQLAEVALYNGDSNITAALMTYMYDAGGKLLGFQYAGSTTIDGTYYYVRNGQGDIIGILDSNGTQVVTYVYDSWGRLLSTTGTGTFATTIGNINPYRYRGYYYDTESGFYYLNSRYYDPVWCRFLSPDALLGANGDMYAYNLYAYCSNNPVMFSDPSGQSKVSVFLSIILSLYKIMPASIKDKIINEININIKKYFEQFQGQKKDKDAIFSKETKAGKVYIGTEDKINQVKSSSAEADNIYILDKRSDPDPNMQILQSYKFREVEDRLEIIDVMLYYEEINPTAWSRTRNSLSDEWDFHNFAWSLNIQRDRTADCDFNNADEGRGFFDFAFTKYKG